jgi:hypothetical protein
MSAEERERLLGLLDTYGEDGKTLFKPAQAVGPGGDGHPPRSGREPAA